MTAIEVLKNSWKSVVIGGVAAYVGTRVPPFKSHLLLAALAAIGVGVLAGTIEAGARKFVRLLR